MSHVPLPVRVAMGLVVTAVEQARKLPEQLTDLPVTAASRAMQAGMRVQQRVTELAIKGDQVFALFRPVEDTPPWATFDEDTEPPRTDAATTDTINNGGLEADTETDGVAPNSTVDGAGGEDADVTAALLAEYDAMSLAQLRTRLRGFSLPQLVGLREHERAHQDRPAFVTLLSNRISSVRAQ